MNFIRFVVGTNQERPRLQTGVVVELRLLKESGDLPHYEHEHVEQLFEWLNNNLPCPPFANANWSKDAISWFKSTAKTHITHFREMIAILEEHGRFVRSLVSSDPGVILYEDDFQVVAESPAF